MNEPKCPDCQIGMEVGFLPDRGYNETHRASWHRGVDADLKSFDSWKAAKVYFENETLPIKAYRCPECGLLRLYANEAEKE